jgi:hypothetical protein
MLGLLADHSTWSNVSSAESFPAQWSAYLKAFSDAGEKSTGTKIFFSRNVGFSVLLRSKVLNFIAAIVGFCAAVHPRSLLVFVHPGLEGLTFRAS